MINIRKRLAATGAAVLLGLGLATIPTSPAQALWSDCPTYAVCIFDGSNGGWPHYHWTNLQHGCYNIGPNWNDRAGSVYNRTPAWIENVSFHEHANCAGDLNPQTLITSNGQMRTFGTGSGLTQYNNIISSFFVDFL